MDQMSDNSAGDYGVTEYIGPSGTLDTAHAAKLLWPGANGLQLDPKSHNLVICEHGERVVSSHDWERGARTPASTASRQVLVADYRGQRLNGPHAVAFAPNGDMLFIDPFIGLQTRTQGDAAEPNSATSDSLDFSGLFLLPARALARLQQSWQ